VQQPYTVRYKFDVWMFIDVVTIMDQSPFNPTLKQKPTHLKPDTTNRKNGYIFVVILNVC